MGAEDQAPAGNMRAPSPGFCANRIRLQPSWSSQLLGGPYMVPKSRDTDMQGKEGGEGCLLVEIPISVWLYFYDPI